MRSMIVGGPASQLHGAKCRLCPHPVREGESVLVDRLPTYGYVDDRYVMHTECVLAAAHRAPEGRPVRAVKAQHAAIRRNAIEVARRTNAAVG